MDGSQITTHDVIQAVRESAMLADVTISVWNAERSDRAAMEQLKTQHGATGNVGRVVKNMLAGADQKLKDVKSAFAQVRTLHYTYTLPWVADPHAERQRGPRLLPHLLFEKYLAALSKQKRVAAQALDEFIAEYPTLIAQAKANLGSLADVDYPSEDDIRSSFRVHFDFEPLPAGAAFKGLPEHTLERLAMALQQKQARMVETATKAMWEETKDRVGHLLARLADPEARFKASTVSNVKELLTLLPGWNLAQAPEVDEVVQDINQMLDGIDAKQLRDDLTTRSDVAAQAKAVVDKLSAWGV